MAGSLNHIVTPSGKFTTERLDHMGDAAEALKDCFDIIAYLVNDEDGEARLREACGALGHPPLKVKPNVSRAEAAWQRWQRSGKRMMTHRGEKELFLAGFDSGRKTP